MECGLTERDTMTFRAMYKGNDVFTASFLIKAADFKSAVDQAVFNLTSIQALTIEQVRVVGVREESDPKYT